VAIANALQKTLPDAASVSFSFYYDAMPSLKTLKVSIAVL